MENEVNLTWRDFEQSPFISENNYAMTIINNIKNLYFQEPRKEWCIEKFQERSYEIWAIDEVLWNILSHPEELYSNIINDLYEEIQGYLLNTRHNPCQNIFTIFLDILELLKNSLNLHSL